MFTLTREVRLAIHPGDAARTDPTPGTNGYGGIPAIEGLAFFYTIRVSLVGDLDRQSSYVRNIKEIDDRVRSLAVPALKALINAGRFTFASAMDALSQQLTGAWPGARVTRIALSTSPHQTISIEPSEPKMIRLSQQFEFAAAHRLHNPDLDDATNRATFGKCNNPHGHGHNYQVEVTLLGTPDASGTLMPVSRFEQIVEQHAISLLDHKFLNIEVEAFKTLNPSVENIAKVIYQMLNPHLKTDHCALASVTVWETPKTYAEYAE
jgi:6-pyruvoyltetrahydropterin/6-carboxytetrahydropterin synthase